MNFPPLSTIPLGTMKKRTLAFVLGKGNLVDPLQIELKSTTTREHLVAAHKTKPFSSIQFKTLLT